MKRFIIFALIILALIVLIQDIFQKKRRNTIVQDKPYVVMLSLDGFRWDYASKTNTPNFDYIIKNGTAASKLEPAFPSKTFPNHYTIATGLYPGNHELISNGFYAPDLNKYYAIRDREAVENGQFYKGEPIWVTAEAQRVKSASYFWVGSEAKIKGYRPTYYKVYDHNFPYEQRLDTVIHWLNLPYADRPHLITWYIDHPDSKGHKYGPDSPEIIESVEFMDSLLGDFLNKVNNLPIKDSVNFIVVSDHGMAATSNEKMVYLNKFLDNTIIDTAIGVSPFTLIYPKEDYKDSVFNILNAVNGISTWKKENIPERYHLKQSKRVSEIIVVADSGWNTAFTNYKNDYSGGTHGYDNTNPDMYGIFYGIGPAFKKNYNAGKLYNTDIYNLISHILEIQPAPNDGIPERIMHVLKDTEKTTESN